MSPLSHDGPERTGRRRKTILFGAVAHGDEVELHLGEIADHFGAELRMCVSSSAFRDAVVEEGDAICLTVLEASFPEVLNAARSTVAAAPSSEFVLLASAQEQANLLGQFGPAPRLGTHWQFAAPQSSTLPRILRTAFQRADQRRATRTTLDRFNARLSAPAQAVDTRELRQLVISDRFLSSILESSFDAVLLVDRAGNIASFNPSAERLFERTRAEILSSPVAGLASGRWARDVQESLAHRRPEVPVQSSIITGEVFRHIELSATPVFDQSQNLVATSLIVRDVTQRILSEEALRTNEKLAAVGRLASSIAHEINNPLESVTNLLYLARLSSDSPEVQQYLDLADQELRRVANITNQTLRFHKQASLPKAVTCAELIEGALEIYKSRFPGRIEVLKRKRATRAVVCLEGEIRQVLNNLVGNAIDAMPVHGKLLLRSREATQWTTGLRGLTITVADTGAGMSAKTITRIFDPFFTTKGVGGTGLGLWISKEIIQRHRGSLQVRSSQREGRSGTVFALFLPFEATIGLSANVP